MTNPPMEPNPLSLDPNHADDCTRELQARGFLGRERSYRQLVTLAGELGADLALDLAQQAADCLDPDLALNGLGRALELLGKPDRELLQVAETRRRLTVLAGASEQLAEFAAEDLARLASLDLSLEKNTTPSTSEPSTSEPSTSKTSTPDVAEEPTPDAVALGRWHRSELVRICLLELDHVIDVETTARALSQLADETVRRALALAAPNQAAPIVVVALGKWGGMELNYSSDIDLFFLRPDPGPGAANAQAADQCARRLLEILSGTPHLYRTDLRLRPGAALVPTLAQAQADLTKQGGTWERMVFIRMRPVAGNVEAARPYLEELSKFTYMHPFQLEDIRKVKGYKELLERSESGRDRERREIKVGWGGIRDVEYVVQFLQLLHGGIYERIRGGNVFQALRELGAIGALSATETVFLLDGYRFLRRVEHQLMLRHRRQRFLLPDDESAQRAIARATGYSDWPSFVAAFDHWRDGIRGVLDRLLHRLFTVEGENAIREVNLMLAFRPEEAEIERVFGPLGFRDPKKAYALLRRLAYPRRAALMAPRARQLLAHLFPAILTRLRETPDPDQAVLLFTNSVEAVGAPATFYELLADHPENCSIFIDLFGRSRFVSELLLDHPGIFDEVIDLLRVGRKLDAESLVEELKSTLQGKDEAGRARTFREFRAVHTLEIAILDLGTRVSIGGIVERLSLLARAILIVADRVAYTETAERLGELEPVGDAPPRRALLALGRLGGSEMGYASDLDLVFLYDGRGRTQEGVTEAQFYTQHFQRVVSILTQSGTGGTLYPVDLRLRPRGSKGTLVHSFREFSTYLTSDECQVWEHQALTRSSAVTGDASLTSEVMDFIRHHIGRGLAASAILEEMMKMHVRRKEGASGEGFYIKTGPGGLLDIEFLVQSALLLGLMRDPELWEPNTHGAIRLLARRGHLSANDAAALSTAYTFFRLVENRLSMLHRSSVKQVPTDDRSLRDLALRVGYSPPGDAAPESYLLDEIRHHTQRVREIFVRRIQSQRAKTT